MGLESNALSLVFQLPRQDSITATADIHSSRCPKHRCSLGDVAEECGITKETAIYADIFKGQAPLPTDEPCGEGQIINALATPIIMLIKHRSHDAIPSNPRR